jgi:predicted nucleotidyltransferase
MSHHQNIARIKAVHDALGDLKNEVVFVGGATVSLYTTRPTSEVRPTEDVDIVVEVFHYNGYAAMEEKLRARGFINDQESGVICRFRINGIVVDVMPVNDVALGFSNKWYPEAFKAAIEHEVDSGYTIKIFSPPYFIASKLEAFFDRVRAMAA